MVQYMRLASGLLACDHCEGVRGETRVGVGMWPVRRSAGGGGRRTPHDSVCESWRVEVEATIGSRQQVWGGGRPM